MDETVSDMNETDHTVFQCEAHVQSSEQADKEKTYQLCLTSQATTNYNPKAPLSSSFQH